MGVLPCANFCFKVSPLESFESLSDVSQLRGSTDHTLSLLALVKPVSGVAYVLVER